METDASVLVGGEEKHYTAKSKFKGCVESFIRCHNNERKRRVGEPFMCRITILQITLQLERVSNELNALQTDSAFVCRSDWYTRNTELPKRSQ